MKAITPELCGKCQGKGLCGMACPILAKFSKSMPKPKVHFSGSSPPEIFVGRHNYPNVNTGILSPEDYGQTEDYSMPEIWHEKKFSIEDILGFRGKLIYGRFRSNVKDAMKERKFLGVMQEISLARKPVSVEVMLKRPPSQNIAIDSHIPIIGNPAPLKFARLEENPKTDRRTEELVSDTDVRSSDAIQEMYSGKVEVSNIIKVLSAGMLGVGFRRKLVPTRWSITAVDDSLSKNILDKVRFYPEISQIQVHSAEYLGNHYEFLLLPDKFSFEVVEAKMTGSVWNPVGESFLMQDYEGFNGRKEYASEVTGAYYANRLALVEYLERIKRQAACYVMREAREEYYAPMGVGVLREASRAAFRSKPEFFNSIDEAYQAISLRLRMPASVFREKSWLLKEYGKQMRLGRWI